MTRCEGCDQQVETTAWSGIDWLCKECIDPALEAYWQALEDRRERANALVA